MKAAGSILLLVTFVSGGREYVPGSPFPPNPVIESKTGEPRMLKSKYYPCQPLQKRRRKNRTAYEEAESASCSQAQYLKYGNIH